MSHSFKSLILALLAGVIGFGIGTVWQQQKARREQTLIAATLFSAGVRYGIVARDLHPDDDIDAVTESAARMFIAVERFLPATVTQEEGDR